jgi:type I restriction enzyme S subunit
MSWQSRPLGAIAKLINGRAFKPSDWGREGLPIVRIQNLNDHSKPFNHFSGSYSASHLIDSGAILLSWSGTPGTSFGCFRWQGGKALVNQHIFKVLVRPEELDGDFFIHAVNSKLSAMIDQAHGGVGLRHITKSKLEALPIPVPPVQEQRRVVERIKECMDRLDEIEHLEKSSTPERLLLGQSLIEDALLGLNGSEVALAEVARIGSELVDPTLPAHIDKPHVGGANIESKTGKLLELKSAREEKLKSAKFPFSPEMVLYNKIRPYLVKVARPTMSGICSADMYPILPDSGRLLRDYLFYQLMSRSFTDYAISGSNRAGMPKVNREHLFAYRFNLPNLIDQAEIVLKLDQATTALEKAREIWGEKANGTRLVRQSILSKAFAGEL